MTWLNGLGVGMLIIMVTTTQLTSFVSGSGGSGARIPKDDLRTGICQRKYIRHPSELETLQGCKVIEGSINFALARPDYPQDWERYSFPELREITGYFFLYDVRNLTSLRRLFPNLMVIRGQELIDTYALIISIGYDLQEIGLPNLTDIQRGSVWIHDNPKLCYVDTIDWGLITNESNVKGISKNKPVQQCQNACRSDCSDRNVTKGHLCWGDEDCQKDFRHLCSHCNGAPCTPQGECCSDQCLGGCSGVTPRDCFVCKHVIFNGTCMAECPHGHYEYLQRRCVTRDECLSINSLPDLHKSTKTLHGKIFEGKRACVLDCPKGTELNQTDCVPCSNCKKNCPGKLVDSIEKARELHGCTRIMGVLKISIRRGSGGLSFGTILNELKENLDKIEEIDHHLVITHTRAILSLDFLESLKLIKGEVLQEDRHALIVRSNDNLMELWSDPQRQVRIGNNASSVLFHHNPKLCPQKIWDFVAQAGIPSPKDDKIDIGTTNGDKVTCNTKILEVEIVKRYNKSVEIRYENFRRNLSLTSHLLTYEIHYKEAPNYPEKNVSKYSDRDPCGADDWMILDYSKMGDEKVKGGLENEPKWEDTRYILRLKPYTWYALFVKTIVIRDENSPNNNTGAESNIKYFQTLAGVPSKPTGLKVIPEGPHSISLAWKPPKDANGKLINFTIFLKADKEDWRVQDQRDYCSPGRSHPEVSTTEKPTMLETFNVTTISSIIKDPECCSCSAYRSERAPVTTPPLEVIHYQDDMVNQLMNYAYVAAQRDDDEASLEEEGRDSVSSILRRRKRSTPFDDDMDEFGIMERVETVPVVEGRYEYTLTFHNLSHFTNYKIGIKACRAAEGNDNGSCSELETNVTRTLGSLTADVIESSTVMLNVTEDGRHIQLNWEEPPNPNGAVMAYVIRIQQLGEKGNSKGSKYLYRDCITREDFQVLRNNNTFYKFPETLRPGNHTVNLQVVSPAGDSEWTGDQYFLIVDAGAGGMSLWVVMLVVTPFTIAIIAGTFLGYKYTAGQKKDPGRIFSPNPEYSQIDIPSNVEVPRNKLTLLESKVLGKGSFGKVVEGVLHDFIKGQELVRCAVKTVREDLAVEYRVLFLKEAALMAKLDSSCHHVVKLLGVISKSPPQYVIMEMMAGGDLRQYLKSTRTGNPAPPTLKQVLRMAAEICDGMAYIHKHKLVHRDLAARNCMVGEGMVVKVGDFGMSREILKGNYYRLNDRALVPVRWMPPESLSDGVFTSQSDIFSFGVVLWEMATLACRPYQGLENDQVKKYVTSGKIMERPDGCPNILYELMRACWRFEARDRPNFIEILNRLTSFLDDSFFHVAFYNTREGLEYRRQLEALEVDVVVDEDFQPLGQFDHDLGDGDSDDDGDDLDLGHYIVDDLGQLPSNLDIFKRETTVPRNGFVVGSLVIHPQKPGNASPLNDDLTLPNHLLPPPPSASNSQQSSYLSMSDSIVGSQGAGGESGSPSPMSSVGSSSPSDFVRNMNIPNGIDSLINIPFQNHRNHHRQDPVKVGNGVAEMGNGNVKRNGFRRFPPIHESQSAHQTTEC